jgi:2-polyprenyl-3-methyl-5-hydroxy-6-metoxy-1,4-benzoquinol methylase
MNDYYEGLNGKLLAAVPADARRVLELGCANGRLGRRFKQEHPGVQWWGVDCSAEATAIAAQHLDKVFTLDLDQLQLEVLGRGFDVIVIGDLLEHLARPAAVLEALYDLSSPDARIVCCLPNMAHLSVIERLVCGDISYDTMGLLDQTHLKFYSPASATKTFLDAGWLPHLQDQYRVELPKSAFAERIVDAAMALGVPRDTAIGNLGLYQMILSCTKWPPPVFTAATRAAPLSVIVPVNRAWQYELNIARSPGLREIGAEVIPVQSAANAAEAYRVGAERATHAWRVLVHQDVYWPVGSGFAMCQQLGALEQAGLHTMPVGCAGLEETPGRPGHVRQAGLLIDRQARFSHGGSSAAVSIDEFAVALHRDSTVAIDPSLGWHLWATDLCLQAQQQHRRAVAQILQVPLFHNSTNDFRLPPAFEASARRLLDKHPQRDRIPTLCGSIDRHAGAAVTA